MAKSVTSTKEGKMLNRDFTKSNKDYFNKNKIVLIVLALFLVVCILLACTVKLRGNFELAGYNEFSVKIGSETKVNTASKKVEQVVKSYNSGFDTILVYGEGDDTQLVVRYLKDLSADEKTEIATKVAEKLGIGVENVSEHNHVAAVVKNTDYIFASVAILLLVALASLFAFIRYNGASALAVIISCLIGSAGFVSICAILRLTVGMSIFTIMIVLNLLIVYGCLNVFESMRKDSWLEAGDYANAIKTAMNQSKFRMNALAIAVFAFGLLFVFIAPSALKYVALNLMFVAVVELAVCLFVLPFVWSACITHCKKRVKKVKQAKPTVEE